MLVSVIITTYNSESTLDRAINSVKNQTGLGELFDIEILAVDDCSIDSTCNILQKHNINFLKTSINSGGPNKGRNIGLKASEGDYICFIDHDDEWLPDKIVKQIKYIEKVKVVTSGYIIHDSTLGTIRNNFEECESGFKYFKKNDTFLKKISKSKIIQRHYFGSIMIRKELKTTLFEEKYGMVDFDWLAKIFENNDSIEVCAPLFIRYIDGPNLSLNEKYRLNDFVHSTQYLEGMQNDYPNEIGLGIKRINGSLARYYYLTGKMNKARELFLKSDINLKTLLYICTSYGGSKIVKKYFNVFG